MNKKYYIAIAILLVVISLVAYYYLKTDKRLGNVRSGEECQEDYQCPTGYKCGLKVDPLPGARGVCIK